jgi:hypothetical protein
LAYLKQKSLNYSLGTFGFWSAFLKGGGDVILVTGTSTKPEYIEPMVRQHLPKWKYIQDPCYSKDNNGIVKLKEECIGLD